MFVGAVKRLLDREHMVIFRRRFDERDHRIVGIERVMEKYVMSAQFFEQVLRFRSKPQFSRREGAILQIGPLRLLINIEQPRKIHRAR